MIVFLGGPTASGKTEVALCLAEKLGARIISADPFQLFREIPILTAQPTAREQARIPHLLYGSLPVSAALDLPRYLQLAQPLLADDSPAVVVGGAGLPMRALLQGGLDPLPPSDPQLRQELEAIPLQILIEELQRRDPESARQIDLRNPRRVIRTLEICRLSGQPASELRRSWQPSASPRIRGAWLQWPRAILHERIAQRTERMFESGVVEEVKACRGLASPSARQAIGFREIEALIDQVTPSAVCRTALIQATRQYAKRQETWFRKEAALMPIPVDASRDATTITREILTALNLSGPPSSADSE